MKPTVQYIRNSECFIQVGLAAFVRTLDHPDIFNVTSGEVARTSPVISYDETSGNFETQNTLYVPAVMQ